MKLDTLERKVKMNVDCSPAIDFSIDQEDMGFVSSILTDRLYSDKVMAVIREYSCNAFDANRENNAKDSVFITIPTKFSPVFKVRDYGTGLGLKDIENTYVKIGKSTKRETNEQDGVFGLGCKSGYAYSDSFNITSYHDGKRWTYTAQKCEDNSLKLIFLGSTESDQPSGIEISIAVAPRDIESFRDKIANFLGYVSDDFKLSEDNFKIDYPEYSLKTKDFAIIKGSGHYYYGNANLIMGNVKYPVDLSQVFDNGNYRDYNDVHFFAPRGEVNIAPDREKLEYTKRTKIWLKKIIKQIKDDYIVETQKAINEKNCYVQACHLAYQSKKFDTTLKDFTYNGKKIIETDDLGQDLKDKPYKMLRRGRKDNFTKIQSHWQVGYIFQNLNTLLIKADPNKLVKPACVVKGWEQKIKTLAEEDIDCVIITEDKDILDKFNVDLWDQRKVIVDYKSLWVKMASGRTGSGGVRYAYQSRNGYKYPIDEITEDKNFVITLGGYVIEEDRKYADALDACDVTYYHIPKSSKSLLGSDWSHAKDVVESQLKQRLSKVNYKHWLMGKLLNDVDVTKESELSLGVTVKELANYKNTYNGNTGLIRSCDKFGIDVPKLCKESINKAKEIRRKYSKCEKMIDILSNYDWRLDNSTKTDIIEYINWKLAQ